jgi:hypothetical protein
MSRSALRKAAGLSQVVYLSRDRMRLEDIDDLVTASARRNARHGITGVLLFGGGHFLQVLEGPPEVVDALVGRIAADPRHTDFEVLLRRPVSSRQFAHWGMVLVGLDGAEEWVDSLRGDRSLERLDRLVGHLARRLQDESRS